jgi:solute carrier family 25, member 34/35
VRWNEFDSVANGTNEGYFKGGMSGIFGSTVGCPLYMIKTQLQAQSHGSYAVGFQHGHKSTTEALRRVLNQNGVKGL